MVEQPKMAVSQNIVIQNSSTHSSSWETNACLDCLRGMESSGLRCEFYLSMLTRSQWPSCLPI